MWLIKFERCREQDVSGPSLWGADTPVSVSVVLSVRPPLCIHWTSNVLCCSVINSPAGPRNHFMRP